MRVHLTHRSRGIGVMYSIQKAKMLGRCRQEMMRGMFIKTHLLKQRNKSKLAHIVVYLSFCIDKYSEKKNKERLIHFDWWFNSTVYHGRRVLDLGPWDSWPCKVHTVRKQSMMISHDQLSFSFSLCLRPKPRKQCFLLIGGSSPHNWSNLKIPHFYKEGLLPKWF